MKKSIAILLSVLMILSCVSIMSASAATTAKVTLNGSDTTYKVGEYFTYSVKLKTVNPIVNGEFYISFPESVLKVSEIHFPFIGDGRVISNYQKNQHDLISFNFSNTNGYNFTNESVLVNVTFAVIAASNATLSLRAEAMSSVGANYILKDEIATAKFTESIKTVPTTISAKAAKSSIEINATTTVTSTVKYSDMKTTYKSSDTKIATVDANGKVKGKALGTVKITATNNGKSATVTIKVTKIKQPMTAKATSSTKNIKYSAVSKKNQTFSIIKVTNNKGSLKYAKASGNSKISVNAANGKITVKKGIKKATYTVKVKVTAAGDKTTYNSGSVTVTFKIKVK